MLACVYGDRGLAHCATCIASECEFNLDFVYDYIMTTSGTYVWLQWSCFTDLDILHSKDYDRWQDREETERLPLDLLRPFESEAMEMREANPKVNNVRNNVPELLEQAERAAESGQLPL
jgi:hypothetical protein